MSDSLDTWIDEFLATNDLDARIFQYLSPHNKLDFDQKIKRLSLVRAALCPHRGASAKSWQAKKSRIIGKLFEQLIASLFRNSKVFKIHQNISTTSSELDFLIVLQVASQKIPFLKNAGAHIIGEAKCHVDGPSVQWVARLKGIMTTHNANFSFLVTACTTRKVNSRVRSEIHINSVQGYTIVPLGWKHLLEIQGGKNILEIMRDQYTSVTARTASLEV